MFSISLGCMFPYKLLCTARHDRICVVCLGYVDKLSTVMRCIKVTVQTLKKYPKIIWMKGWSSSVLVGINVDKELNSGWRTTCINSYLCAALRCFRFLKSMQIFSTPQDISNKFFIGLSKSLFLSLQHQQETTANYYEMASLCRASRILRLHLRVCSELWISDSDISRPKAMSRQRWWSTLLLHTLEIGWHV